ncbi:GDSL-type esterase/lipase family protein [Edaphobacter modestus]|uniref:Lysophospholipase L1-like esterase n=1 Tax=Edaphobacter modestus TaxID=388466 RepID=A0A4Q7YTM9_9BACT|nr:GDSL-type esterase/lipase family protein [Edaphobacter modestus]RZU41182.1 lysophospholipase L1-like esterase [Edaphobacter modestus]
MISWFKLVFFEWGGCGTKFYKVLACLLFLLVGVGCGQGAAAPLPASINDKTVFIGDSITYFWKLPKHNLGIPGQRTAQNEARFQTAVVQSGLPQVIILTGANDVRVPSPDYSGIIANIEKMVAQGRAAGIDVILCELTPITCCDTQVRTLNAMIKDYATSQHLILVDYYTPMAGKDATYLKDGLHPNTLGYAIMEDTLTQILQPAS